MTMREDRTVRRSGKRGPAERAENRDEAILINRERLTIAEESEEGVDPRNSAVRYVANRFTRP